MDQKIISSVCKQVYQKFPEIRGSTPKMKIQANESVLFIFDGKVKTADGRTMQRTVRAVVNSAGKITKLTTSR